MRLDRHGLRVGGFVAGLLAVAVGCASPVAPRPLPLRVGVTPNYPPLVFQERGQLAGAEVDLAYALGAELGRPVRFVSLAWDDQIAALLDGRTDIIMSGLSVTPERQERVAFAEPYVGNHLYALVRREDVAAFPSAEAVLATTSVVGVIPHTTGDAFLRAACPRAQRHAVADSATAPAWLQEGRLQVFIDDGWSIAHLASQHTGALAVVRGPLQQETLAWAVRPGDAALLEQVNAALVRWREDGTLISAIRRWVPHIDLLN